MVQPSPMPLCRAIVRVLVIDVVLSLSLAAVLTHGHWSRFPIHAAVAALYGGSIGLPAMLVLRALRPRLFGRPALQQWLVYLGVLLIITVVATFFVRLVLVGVGLLTLDEMWAGMIDSLEISAAIAVPCTIGAASFSRMRHRLSAVEALATEARLASLESRVRPHFLFNALNSAIALIPEDPRRAEDVLERLSALLRFSLDAHDRLVPLREELRVVVDYLEIERVRFGERLAYQLDVPPALEATRVPAFAVQTLVENSVKYAVSPRKQGATIAVRAREQAGRLLLEVADDGPGFAGEIWVPGHGLESLRARLAALYGGTARLLVPTGQAGGAAVTLEVPA